MIRKQIVATTGLDRQNQQISLNTLKEYVESFNNSSETTRMSINHDCTLLPVGKILSGQLKQLDNGEVALEALIDDFIDEFSLCLGPNGENLYRAKSTHDFRPFVSYEGNSNVQLTVMLNPLNFEPTDFEDVSAYLRDYCNAQVKTTISKNVFPDPQIIFMLISGCLLCGGFAKKVLDKTSEKLADAISDDFVDLYGCVKNGIIKVAQKLASNKQVTYLFIDPEQHTEFVVKAKTADAVLIALDTLNDYNYIQKVEQFQQYTNENLQSIQFVYDDISKKWEMSYLTTKTGEVIGTEANYKQAVHLYQSILKSPTAGFSISGTAILSNENEDNTPKSK